jgi:hypothetical protein
MGAVVTRSVPAYTLVIGTPARPLALVCRCGRPIASLLDRPPPDGDYSCAACDTTYSVVGSQVVRDPLGGDLPDPRPSSSALLTPVDLDRDPAVAAEPAI